MSTLTKSLTAAFALVSCLSPALSQAAEGDTLACSISVEHKANDAVRFTYAKDFVLSTSAGFSEDFSSGSRWREFEASVNADSGTPIVSFSLLADLSAFDVVELDGTLNVHDLVNGSTTTVRSSFQNSNVRYTTQYLLTCRQAVN